MLFCADQLEAKTLRQQIAAQIREALLRGALKPGEKIVERDLAAQFGVSLTVVREAIIQLETEGVIVKRANASTSVVQLSMREVLDIFAVRRELERYAFIEAARRISDKDCARLKRLHKEAVRQAKAGDSDAYIRADLAWHEAVWRITQNRFLETALQRAVIPLFGFSYIQFAAAESFDLTDDAKTHEPLLNALCEKNPQRAEQEFEKAVEVWMDYALELTD
jgi:DNA-binding GntR family transcriptional regulator